MAMFTMPELASYLRVPLPDLDIDLATLLQELTEGVITAEVGTIDPVPVRVKAIALEVASRAYRNPEGARTRTVGPFSQGLPDETANAGVYLLPSETAKLLLLVARSSVGSIRLGTVYGRDYPSTYVPPGPTYGPYPSMWPSA